MADLKRLRIPSGALRVEIDAPYDLYLEKPAGDIRGWFAADDIEIPKEFSLQAGGITMPHRVVRREDVETAMPDYTIRGFVIPYDLVSYLPYLQEDNYLVIQLTVPGYNPHTLRLKIKDSALAGCLETAGGV